MWSHAQCAVHSGAHLSPLMQSKKLNPKPLNYMYLKVTIFCGYYCLKKKILQIGTKMLNFVHINKVLLACSLLNITIE